MPPDYDARDYAPAITPAQANAAAAARRAGVVPSRDEVLAQGTQLPELRLDLHVYDPDPAKRFVFLNMRKLREGESLPDGVRVDSITPDGRAALPIAARNSRWTPTSGCERSIGRCSGFPREVVAFQVREAREAGLACSTSAANNVRRPLRQ